MHWSWVEKALTLLAWPSHCLHSDILSKSPGPQPLAHLPSALAASPAHVARETWGGTFPRMSSGSEQRARIVIAQQQHLSKGWLAITRARPPAFSPTPDHRPHTYPSSVHTPPASSLTADRGREDGAIPGPQCSQTISGTKGILVTNERYSQHASDLLNTVWLLWVQ